MSSAVVLALVIPLAFASGINVYATVAVIGLAAHAGLIALPAQFSAFAHEWVIAAAIVLYAIEFVADKVPWVDSAWDALHTIIRPAGGALVALLAAGGAPADIQIIAALLGGSVALTSHLAKAGTRVIVNASPEPFSNWGLSISEDAMVPAGLWLAFAHPLVFLCLLALFCLAAVLLARAALRGLRLLLRLLAGT